MARGSEDFVLTEIRDSAAWITLNEPARLNPVTLSRVSEINRAAAAVSDRDDVHVVVITGAGRGFCSGADLSSAQADSSSEPAPQEFPAGSGSLLPGDGLWTLGAMAQPVIAMVNGPAVGYGAELALQADIRLAGASARIGFPFARLGVVSDTGAATWLLPRLIGLSRAADVLYSARMLGAEEALGLGLFDRVFPDAELGAATEAYVKELAANSPWALRGLKRMLLAGLDEPKRAHVTRQMFEFREAMQRVDQRQVQARFRGRKGE